LFEKISIGGLLVSTPTSTPVYGLLADPVAWQMTPFVPSSFAAVLPADAPLGDVGLAGSPLHATMRIQAAILRVPATTSRWAVPTLVGVLISAPP